MFCRCQQLVLLHIALQLTAHSTATHCTQHSNSLHTALQLTAEALQLTAHCTATHCTQRCNSLHTALQLTAHSTATHCTQHCNSLHSAANNDPCLYFIYLIRKYKKYFLKVHIYHLVIKQDVRGRKLGIN